MLQFVGLNLFKKYHFKSNLQNAESRDSRLTQRVLNVISYGHGRDTLSLPIKDQTVMKMIQSHSVHMKMQGRFCIFG